MFTVKYSVYTAKTRFPARSMKTKALFLRYPRKISRLKDLRRGYRGTFPVRKSMNTGRKLGIPSKISLLKDLTGDILEEERSFSVNPPAWEISKLSKSLQSHCCYQTANALVIMLADWGRPGQAKKPAGTGHGGKEREVLMRSGRNELSRARVSSILTRYSEFTIFLFADGAERIAREMKP
jgi:hypothetical protein